ncbi:MAG: (Fe-S)-binding protein [Chloroflexi bacterium]|nr:(Fe-S)-binding protein [Chloroflexota bacterium]
MSVTFKDMARAGDKPLLSFTSEELMAVPPLHGTPSLQPPKARWLENYDLSLDGFSDFDIPKPKTPEDEERLVNGFLSGLQKLFDPESNWPFVKILKLSMDYCVRCQTCSEACHVYLGSGRQEIYRPTFRSEVLRRIYQRYLTPGGQWLKSFVGADVALNYNTVWRLLELAYRCNLCRRCAQVCPVGVDNALLAREIRKLFSQEMGIAPTELLRKGTRQHLRAGSTTGMNLAAFKDLIEFSEEDIYAKTGKKIKMPVDQKGADILLIHNAGEFMAWPENPAAFAILFDAAGINWTLSSEAQGYDGVNYGVWFDDVELARIALRQVSIAQELGVRKIVVGECGHAHKALCVIADRVLPGDLSLSEIPRESCLPLLWQIVQSGAIKFDPARNDFPVTLHDSCNVVRLMGIVQPQREIIKHICAQPLREMAPNGVWNYCCGGGSGFAIMNTLNFADWRKNVSERVKTKQVLEAFQDVLDPSINKYVVAACSNCKGALRDAIGHYGLWDKYHINYGGLVDLMVNAMADLPAPYIEWNREFR